MALVQAKCSNCGANLVINCDDEIATCPYCNSSFLIQDVIHNHYYSNYISAENLTIEDTTIENKIRSAEAFLKMRRFQDALSLFTEITQDAPYDYRGWLGIIQSITEDFSIVSCSRSSFMQLQDAYRNMQLFLPQSELEKNNLMYKTYFEQLKKRMDENETRKMTRLHEINEEKRIMQGKIHECENRIRMLQEKRYSYCNITSGRLSQYVLIVAVALGLLLLASGENASLAMILLAFPVLIIFFAAISNISIKQEMKDTDKKISATIHEKQQLQARCNELESELHNLANN